MATRQESADFARANLKAMLFLLQAANDYADARCLLLSGRPGGGLVVGAQAVEKFLKAYLLFEDPSIVVKKLSHKVPVLHARAMEKDAELAKFSAFSVELEMHYNTRYPDNADRSKSQSTEEITRLDDYVVYLSDTMPLPRNNKVSSGVFGLIGDPAENREAPCRTWIIERNDAFSKKKEKFLNEYKDAMQEMYPNQPAA